MIIGYLDKKDKNIDTQKQQVILSDYAENHSMPIDLMLSGDSIDSLKDNIKTKGHTLLIANVLALGDSLNQIIDSIEILSSNGHSIISVTDKISFSNKKTQSLIKGLRLACDIRSSLASITTCSVLNQKKASGQKLGRCFGSKNRNSAAKKYKEIVLKELAEGKSKSSIARQLKISARTIYNILKNEGVNNVCSQ